MDQARVTNGARESKFAIMHSMCKEGDYVVLDGNAHYSSVIAAQRARLEIKMAQKTPAPEYRITPEAFAAAFEEVKAESGEAPGAGAAHVPGRQLREHTGREGDHEDRPRLQGPDYRQWRICHRPHAFPGQRPRRRFRLGKRAQVYGLVGPGRRARRERAVRCHRAPEVTHA